ncbi:MAG: GNAT family N-acetyltransferase [Sediminibacterium sp.]|nr:GNAT family N-acetyltransferase [Sediminibacterium sp.]
MNKFNDFTIRLIEKKDNQFIAKIIRNCLEEFNANKPGTVYFDSTTDDLYSLFNEPNSVYYVVEKEGIIYGGAGLFPTPQLPSNTVELVKIYLTPQVRKIGLGKYLIEYLFKEATKLGYNKIYLESMPELAGAVNLYLKMGFKKRGNPLGNSGHCGCDIWMEKNI